MKIWASIVGLVFIAGTVFPVAAQTAAGAGQPPVQDRGSAYYHFAMGHLLTELAGEFNNRSDYIDEAIDHYKQALKADPSAGFITDELADLYVQGNRLTAGINDAEAALKANPDDVNAHRLLGRIYTRLIGDTQTGSMNQEYLKNATDQFNQVVRIAPDDQDAWLTLGRLNRLGRHPDEAKAAFSKALELDPSSEDAMVGLALAYSDEGDTAKAAEMFKKVADADPNLSTLTALAGAYEQMREYSLAAETLKRAIELAADNPNLKQALALDLMNADKQDEALVIFKELVEADPSDAQSWLRISQIYRDEQDFAEARKANDKAKNLAPDNIEVLYNEVGILEAEGKPDEAISTLKGILESTARPSYTASEENNRALLLERLGLLCRNNEKFDDALDAFRQLGALNPSMEARASAQVMDTYRQAKDFPKARAEGEAAVKKWPDDRTIRSVYATVLAESGDLDAGVAEMKKLLGGDRDRETWLGIAQIYERAKKYAGMAGPLDEAEKLSTTGDEKEGVHFMRGAMYERMKNIEKSEVEFRKVLAINPDSASALNYLGYMLADNNMRLNEALDMIQQALKQEPNNGAYLDSLGWVFFRMGKLDEAVDYLKRALDREGDDPTINDHLGDVYSKQGKLKEAVAVWEKALQLWHDTPATSQEPQEISKIQRKVESARMRLASQQPSGTRN